LHNRAAAPSTRQRAKPTPISRARPSSQHRSRRERCHPPRQEVSDEEPNLLESFDEDETVANLAARGIEEVSLVQFMRPHLT
jgi:hypothetical protein